MQFHFYSITKKGTTDSESPRFINRVRCQSYFCRCYAKDIMDWEEK